MIREARLKHTETGLVPAEDGWFVLNAQEARWDSGEGRGARLRLEGDTDFAQVGINLYVLAPGEPMAVYHWEDLGRSLVTLGERDEADGQVWHLPAAEPLTCRQFLELLFEEARQPPKIAVASRPMIRIGGLFNPLLRELNETLYQFERPFVSDASKFQAAFGPFEPTPHRAAVSRTVDWFRRRYAA